MNYSNKEIIIALCAGEASGDLLGAHLIEALKKRHRYSRFVGIGGPRMKAAGLISLYDQEPLAVRGYFEVLSNVFEILSIRKGLIADLKKIRPHVFVGIDSPDFNLPVAAKLRAAGIPTLHYVSPSVWAWKSGRVKKIVKQVNEVLCLFPMEPALYQAVGGKAQFVGHPLAQILPMENNKVSVRERLKLDITAPVFTLMPGSRVSEIDYMAPLFLRAAALILQKLPEAIFLLPYPSAPVREALLRYLNRDEFKQLPIRLQAAKTELACMAADVVLVTSGTATLEVALCKRPMVISYKISAFTYALVRRKIKIPHIGLPNILLGREIVPELIQKEATPEKLANAVLDWYYHPVRSAELEKQFTRLHQALSRNTDELVAHAVLTEAGLTLPDIIEKVEENSVMEEVLHETATNIEDDDKLRPEQEQVMQPEVKTDEIEQTVHEDIGEDQHQEHGLFGKVKKWFGNHSEEETIVPSTDNVSKPARTPKTPAEVAAVRLAEDVAEAHNQQPERRVLEIDEEEIQEAVSPIALPKSNVLQNHKSTIFDKYRQKVDDEFTARTMSESISQSTLTQQTQEAVMADTQSVSRPRNKSLSNSTYAQYINQITMAWLPSQGAAQRISLESVIGVEAEKEEIDHTDDSVSVIEEISTEQIDLTDEVNNIETDREVRQIDIETALLVPDDVSEVVHLPPEEETEHSVTETTIIKRPSVSRYSSNPQRYGRNNGKGMFF